MTVTLHCQYRRIELISNLTMSEQCKVCHLMSAEGQAGWPLLQPGHGRWEGLHKEEWETNIGRD